MKQDLSACFIVLVPVKGSNKCPRKITQKYNQDSSELHILR